MGKNTARWVAYVLGLALPLFVLSLTAVHILYRINVRPYLEFARDSQAKNLQAYLEDINYLSRFELLRPRTEGTTDAGTVLNAKVFWAPKPEDFRLTHPGAAKPIVPPPIREELLRLRYEWMEKSFKARRMKADLSFFDHLRNFDHWNIEIGSPIEDLTKAHLFIPPVRLPIPEVSDLLAAAKLRLMQGDINKDSLKALSDVRELARLLLTTESMQMVLAGLAILDEERMAYRHFVDKGVLESTAWSPVDRNITRRARRAILATREFLHLWTPEASIKEIFLGVNLPPGFCAAANEAFPINYSLRPLLEPRLIFELSLRNEYTIIDSVFERAQSGCRLRYLKGLAEADAFDIDIPAPLVLSRIPYSRKVFALRLSVLNFGGFDAYK